MEQKLALSADTAFGLAFDVEKASDRTSGFKPAQFDRSAAKDLFGDLRLDGFAALLRIGFARKLVIIGGNEKRYENETPQINRAWAIREMLIHDCGISPDVVASISSKANTTGNVDAMAEWMREGNLSIRECAVVSNHYHLPRASVDLVAADLPIPLYAAEAFWLIDGPDARLNELIERLDGGRMAERMASEIKGIADKVIGSYKPLADVANVDLPERILQQ